MIKEECSGFFFFPLMQIDQFAHKSSTAVNKAPNSLYSQRTRLKWFCFSSPPRTKCFLRTVNPKTCHLFALLLLFSSEKKICFSLLKSKSNVELLHFNFSPAISLRWNWFMQFYLQFKWHWKCFFITTTSVLKDLTPTNGVQGVWVILPNKSILRGRWHLLVLVAWSMATFPLRRV